MNRTKRTFAAILAALMIVVGIPFAPGAALAFALDVTTAEDPPYEVCDPDDLQLPPIPEGYHFSGMTFEDADGSIYYYAEGEPSIYGLIDGCWVDEAGNILSDREDPNYGSVQFAEDELNDLPARFDARELGIVTSVKNQTFGTCWAHAAMANIETNAIKKGLASPDEIDLSEYHLVWTAYNNYYEGIEDQKNDGRTDNIVARIDTGGNAQFAGYSLMSLNGPAQESRYRDFGSIYSQEAMAAAMAEDITYNERFTHDFVVTNVDSVPMNRDSIKAAVLKYGSVQISYTDNIGCFSKVKNGSPCAYYNPSGDPGYGHAVTLIGWDDDFSVDYFTAKETKPAGNGAWLIKNSWGTTFGNDGYFWMSYYEPSLRSCYIYETEAADNFQNVYLYDGWRTSLLANATNAGNIFTADGDEYLTKVSLGGNTNDYSFRIYANVAENAADPTQGTLIYSQSGNAGGSRWIDVFGSVRITAGQRFAVVFDELSQVYLEGQSGYIASLDMSSYFQSRPGTSFYKNGSSWVDSSVNGKNNVCIRAATRNSGEGSYSVTYTCPGQYSETVPVINATAQLPQTADHTWVLTYNDAPFTGVGVTQSCAVLAHCYPDNGTPKAGAACTTEYRCVYCGAEMKDSVAHHRYTDTVFTADADCLGYIRHICADCGYIEKDSFTFVPGSRNGICDGFAWQIAQGVLSVVGVGDLPDFASAAETPWYPFRDEIVSIRVSEDITSVGANAFASLSSAKTVSLPDTVAEIGAGAFRGDSALEAFTAPAALEKIGDYAFRNTNALASVTFNDKIKILGTEVFTDCALTEAVLPGSVTSYGNNLYSNCLKVEKLVIEEGVTSLLNSVFYVYSTAAKLKTVVIPSTVCKIYYNFISGGMFTLEEYVVAEDNPYLYAEDGVLYTNGRLASTGVLQPVSGIRMLLSYPQNKPGKYWKAPSDVTNISPYAFCKNWSLSYLDLSDTKETDVLRNSFWLMANLRNIDLPSGATSIAADAFAYNNAEKVYLPDSIANINAQAFRSPMTRPVICTDSAGAAAKTFADSQSFTCEVLEGHTHAYTQTAYTENATCQAEGYVIKTCECGNFTAETLPSVAHTKANAVVTEPTCERGGYTTYTCSVCGTVFTDDETPALEHHYTWIVDRAATCGKAGVKHEECSVCGAVRSGNTEIPATGKHTYKWITDRAATCGKAGVKHEECSVCGAVRSGNTAIPATGNHGWGAWTVTKKAACETDGSKSRVCAVCGRTETQTIPAAGHSDADKNGVCDRCGASVSQPEQHDEICKFCGGVHSGPFGAIVKLFHSIMYFFRNLFGK